MDFKILSFGNYNYAKIGIVQTSSDDSVMSFYFCIQSTINCPWSLSQQLVKNNSFFSFHSESTPLAITASNSKVYQTATYLATFQLLKYTHHHLCLLQRIHSELQSFVQQILLAFHRMAEMAFQQPKLPLAH